MLYLLLADGSTKLVPDATNARIDLEDGELICFDQAGQEVARFAGQSVTRFSDRPFPAATVLQAQRRSDLDE